ncbi:MAG: hypothetical protein ACTH2Q_01485 [Propionibacteriaceae bacterium]
MTIIAFLLGLAVALFLVPPSVSRSLQQRTRRTIAQLVSRDRTKNNKE